MNRICPTHANTIYKYCFGNIWYRPFLDLRAREPIVIATAAAWDLPDKVGEHTKGSLSRGVAPEAVIEAILQCVPYIGFPKTNHAFRAAQKIING
ncbi:carboxymuconolactone decarboxylase family protein [Alphaproteobacteria bacterium]|jgi:4-carboxymuconolactone decarboxylase|nr:carboxymuconolactone decarboxylase family protein [Alphaproteobacteria bacterium]